MSTNPFFVLKNPLHALPDRNQVSVAILRRFSELVRGLGGDPVKLMTQNDIYIRSARDANRFVNCRSYVNLLEQSAAELGQPLFGLHLAELQDPDVFGVVSALCRSASDLRAALDCLVEFIPVVHSAESLLELVEGKETAELRLIERLSLGVNDQATLQGLTLSLKVLRMLGGDGFEPHYISLPLEMNIHAPVELEKALGCEVRVTAGRSCIGFGVSALDAPVSSASRPLFGLLYGYLSQLRNTSIPSFNDRVSEHVLNVLTGGDISIEHCAEMLGVSTRTLQLRLKGDGLSYSDIVEQQRRRRATIALENPRFSVSDVADLLGYSERTSFGRAFKRWTGLTPQQYREKHIGGKTLA